MVGAGNNVVQAQGVAVDFIQRANIEVEFGGAVRNIVLIFFSHA